jgi:hypothetical protein
MENIFKSKQQIANELNICVKTLNTRLLKMGVKIPRGLIDPKTQRKVYRLLGSDSLEKNVKTH